MKRARKSWRQGWFFGVNSICPSAINGSTKRGDTKRSGKMSDVFLGKLSLLLALVLAALSGLTERVDAADRMYWTDSGTGKIQRANLDGSGVESPVTGLSEPSGIALDAAGGKMYWGSTQKISRANLDGSGAEDLVGSVGPAGIALDVAGGKVYWTDVFVTGRIQRANLLGTGVEDLVTSVADREGIALDVASGKIYWTDRSGLMGRIQRANLDGSGIEDLITTGLIDPRGIALDVAGGKMYWTDALTGKIQRAKLDGTAVEDLVVAGLVNPDGIALHLVGGKMYWTDFGTHKIQRANLSGSGVEDLVIGLSMPVGIMIESGTPEPAVGGIIAGFVKSDSGGAGIGNVRVQVYGAAVMPMPPMLVGETQTDTSGAYRMSGLQNGTYLVCFDGSLGNYMNECYNDKPWNSWSDIANATPVAVITGQTTTLGDAALSPGGAITGSVTNNGVGIGNVWVNAYDSNNMWVRQVQTDSGGNYNIGGLQTGSYKVCFDASMTMAGYLNECYDNKAWGDIANATPVPVSAGQTTSMINAILSRGGVITGAVRNISNIGIGNVSVQVYNLSVPEPMPAGSTLTDPSGSYSVGGLQTGAYTVCFDGSSSGYIKECYDDKPWITWNDIVSADSVSVVAEQTVYLSDAALTSGGTISGQVTSDGTTGISSVWVYVCRYDSMTGMCNYAGGTSTDMNGNYAVGGLATGGYKIWFDTSMLIMSGLDYLSQWFNDKTDEASADILTVTAPAASTVNVQLVKGGKISGTVTNGTTGIPGVWARVYDSNGVPLPLMGMGATTNPDGTYSVGGLRTGGYKVCFDAAGAGYLSQCYFNKAYDPANADTVSVAASYTTSGIDAVLVMGGIVIGRVTDGMSGLFNVNVVLYDAFTGMWAGGAMTDWNGNYSIGGLASGVYKVYFSSMTPGYLSEWYNDKPDMSTADAVPVTAGQTAFLSDAVLAQPGSITGAVKNEGGTGIANATVTVFDMNMMMPMMIRSASTDTNGIYTITGLQAGTYRVCFDGLFSGYINECYNDKPWNSWSDIANADPVSVTLGQTMSLNDAILAQGGTIAGVVKNGSGFGIGMVTISVYDSAGMWVRGTSTDLSGSYSVGGLQTGIYKVCFDGSMAGYGNECYNNQADPMNATPIPVIAGQTKVLDDAVLDRLGAVTGAVKNSGGAGIGNVWVTVFDTSMMMPMPVRSAPTDTNGDYTITGLQTGTYRVCFDGLFNGYINECYNDKPWNSWSDIAMASAVSVTAGQTANLDDAVLVMGGVIAGTVTNSGGSGIGMVTVNVYDTSNTQVRSISTDFNGNYAVGGLRGGGYKVCFDGGTAGYSSECYDNQAWMDLANAELITVVTGQTTTLGNAVLAPGGVIAGAVKNGGGSGIGMVTVNVYDSNNMWLRGTMTDWNGSYSIGGLSTGNYKVCFDAMMVFGYSSECYDDRTWMDLVNATVVSVASGQTTTLNDAVLAQFSPIPDTEPDAFAFIGQTGVAPNTMVVSNTITVTGINAGAPISITGGQYSVNGETFTNGTGTVYNGDAVSVRVTSSRLSLTTVSATLTIGGVSAVFNVTTREAYQFIGFLQPVMNDGSSIFESGRTVPVKFQLTDGSGAFVANASATLRVYKVSEDILGTTNVDSSGSGGSDTLFRYDFASNQYIYNRSTSGLGTGTFMLRVDLDDGTVHEVRISLR